MEKGIQSLLSQTQNERRLTRFQPENAREGERALRMELFDAAYAMFVSDPEVQRAVESIVHDIARHGLRYSVDGKEEALPPELEKHLTRSVVRRVLQPAIFVYMVSGFLVFYRDRDDRGNVVPKLPPWGYFRITREMQGLEPVYRAYVFLRGRWRQHHDVCIRRYQPNENGMSEFPDSMLVSLIPDRMRQMFLTDADNQAYRYLSRPPVLLERLPNNEKEPAKDILQEMANMYYRQTRSDWEDPDSFDADEAVQKLQKKIKTLQTEQQLHEESLKMQAAAYARNLAGARPDVSPEDLCSAMLHSPTSLLVDSVRLPENYRVARVAPPVLRPDFLEHMKQLKAAVMDRLGYIPASVVLGRSTRASTESKTIESERRHALDAWVGVANDMLTDIYVFLYRDYAEHKRVATALLRGRPKEQLKAVLRRFKEEDSRTYELSLGFSDVLPVALAEDFYAKGFVEPESYMESALKNVGVSRSCSDRILRESRGALRELRQAKKAALSAEAAPSASSAKNERATDAGLLENAPRGVDRASKPAAAAAKPKSAPASPAEKKATASSKKNEASKEKKTEGEANERTKEKKKRPAEPSERREKKEGEPEKEKKKEKKDAAPKEREKGKPDEEPNSKAKRKRGEEKEERGTESRSKQTREAPSGKKRRRRPSGEKARVPSERSSSSSSSSSGSDADGESSSSSSSEDEDGRGRRRRSGPVRKKARTARRSRGNDSESSSSSSSSSDDQERPKRPKAKRNSKEASTHRSRASGDPFVVFLEPESTTADPSIPTPRVDAIEAI